MSPPIGNAKKISFRFWKCWKTNAWIVDNSWKNSWKRTQRHCNCAKFFGASLPWNRKPRKGKRIPTAGGRKIWTQKLLPCPSATARFCSTTKKACGFTASKKAVTSSKPSLLTNKEIRWTMKKAKRRLSHLLTIATIQVLVVLVSESVLESASKSRLRKGRFVLTSVLVFEWHRNLPYPNQIFKPIGKLHCRSTTPSGSFFSRKNQRFSQANHWKTTNCRSHKTKKIASRYKNSWQIWRHFLFLYRETTQTRSNRLPKGSSANIF